MTRLDTKASTRSRVAGSASISAPTRASVAPERRANSRATGTFERACHTRRWESGDLGEPPADRALASGGPAKDPPCHLLKLLVAPALGLLDGAALVFVDGKERRLKRERVERAGDLARALDAPAVHLERRDRRPAKAGEPELDRVEAR